MKKECISVIKYTAIDDRYDKILELHRSITDKTKMKDLSIYYEDNYKSYFKSIVEQSLEDYIFILEAKNDVIGFVHYKCIENTIFMNTISLAHGITGRGYGSILFRNSLNIMRENKYVNVSLDVLSSNHLAYKWYSKLGFKVISRGEWIEILSVDNLTENAEIKRGIDENGFDSLFFNSQKIATIICEKYVIIHTLSNLNVIPIHKYKRAVVFIEDTNNYPGSLNYAVLEQRCRMQADIDVVLTELEKVRIRII